MALKRDILIGLALVLSGFLLLVIVIGSLGLSEHRGLFSGGGKRIAVVEITGLIENPSDIIRQIKRYTKSDRIPAIIIRIESPGGGVVASQEIYEEVHRARSNGKIVVVSMGSVAASGGYYIACAADTIIANKGTVTGSIGVVAFFPDLEKMMEKLGIRVNVVKSGKFKDTGALYRDISPEDRDLIKEVVMDLYDQFLDDISYSRNMDKETVRSLADGRVFTGRQALHLGLVDILGNFEHAKTVTAAMAGLSPDTPTVTEKKKDFWSNLLTGTFIRILGYAGILPSGCLHFGYVYVP